MAALVLLYLYAEMRDMYSTGSFPHLILLENGPKVAEIETETWWRAYWTDAKVEKAKMC